MHLPKHCGKQVTGEGSTLLPKHGYHGIEGRDRERTEDGSFTLSWLEEMARELGEEGEEGVEIIPYYQMNGAGSRQCKKLLTMIDEEFNRRGWIFRFQPSQTPESNIKDSCLTKSLPSCDNRKGRSNWSYSFKVEKLWKTVLKCWEEMPNEVLAWAYALHHQIVNAMIVNNGKNNFYTKRVGYTLDAGSNL